MIKRSVFFCSFLCLFSFAFVSCDDFSGQQNLSDSNQTLLEKTPDQSKTSEPTPTPDPTRTSTQVSIPDATSTPATTNAPVLIQTKETVEEKIALLTPDPTKTSTKVSIPDATSAPATTSAPVLTQTKETVEEKIALLKKNFGLSDRDFKDFVKGKISESDHGLIYDFALIASRIDIKEFRRQFENILEQCYHVDDYGKNVGDHIQSKINACEFIVSSEQLPQFIRILDPHHQINFTLQEWRDYITIFSKWKFYDFLFKTRNSDFFQKFILDGWIQWARSLKPSDKMKVYKNLEDIENEFRFFDEKEENLYHEIIDSLKEDLQNLNKQFGLSDEKFSFFLKNRIDWHDKGDRSYLFTLVASRLDLKEFRNQLEALLVQKCQNMNNGKKMDDLVKKRIKAFEKIAFDDSLLNQILDVHPTLREALTPQEWREYFLIIETWVAYLPFFYKFDLSVENYVKNMEMMFFHHFHVFQKNANEKMLLFQPTPEEVGSDE